MSSLNKQSLIELFETGKKPRGEDFATLIQALCDEIDHKVSIINHMIMKDVYAGTKSIEFQIPGIKSDNYSFVLAYDEGLWNPNQYSLSVDEQREVLIVTCNIDVRAMITLSISVFS